MSSQYENKPIDGIDEDIAWYFAIGKSVKWVAQKTDLAEGTVKHRKSNPLVKKLIEENRQYLTQRNRGMVLAYSVEVIKKMYQIVKKEDSENKDRISAGKLLLDQYNKAGEIEVLAQQLEDLKNEFNDLTKGDRGISDTEDAVTPGKE